TAPPSQGGRCCQTLVTWGTLKKTYRATAAVSQKNTWSSRLPRRLFSQSRSGGVGLVAGTGGESSGVLEIVATVAPSRTAPAGVNTYRRAGAIQPPEHPRDDSPLRQHPAPAGRAA